MSVTGTGIPANAYVDTVTSVTEFELSVSTTGGSVTDGTLTFSGSLQQMIISSWVILQVVALG